MKINFDVCRQASVGFSGSITQASFILNNSNLYVGNVYDAYLYKSQPGRCAVIGFPQINGYGNSAYDDGTVSKNLPGIGLTFLIISASLILFSLFFTFKKCYREHINKIGISVPVPAPDPDPAPAPDPAVPSIHVPETSISDSDPSNTNLCMKL